MTFKSSSTITTWPVRVSVGGAARYAAVLAGRSEVEVERATAFGFFLGFGLGTLALVVESAT
jgi:hypothetical protein